MSRKQKADLESEMRKETEALLEVIWAMAGAEEFDTLARRSGLSTATLYRLWGGVWVRPQFLTFQKLGRAVGLKISGTQNGHAISLEGDLLEV